LKNGREKNNKRNSRMPRKTKSEFIFFFVNEEILFEVAPFSGRDKAEEANNAEGS
jgi:hypothetical protein